ncbi:MAG: hypothetical protein ABIO63_02110 [Casimicrobiaceae bacterium]
MLNFSLFRSKAVWGALITVLAYLSQPAVLAILPEKVAAIVGAIGALLGAIGYRDAIAKNGSRE